MNRFVKLFQGAVVLMLILASAAPATAAPASGGKKTGGYQTGLALWREFSGWELSGTQTVQIDANRQALLMSDAAQPGEDPYPAGGYNGHNYYNGGAFLVGEATSPWVTPKISFSEAIASWNATTPPGTWVETQVRAKIGGSETKWYSLGIWASDTGTVERHSVNLQGDTNAYVAVDTLVLSDKVTASALQVKVRLFAAEGVQATPTLRSVSLAYSPSAPKKVGLTEPSLGVNHSIEVPPCSQMVYTDGGNVWCSPTSTSMVLGRWGVGEADCASRVYAAVAGTYDWLYDGNGNWPFNPAYAQDAGYAAGIPLEGYVVRYNSLAQLEPLIAADVPVVMSIAWNKGELTNAPVKSSGGHLIVLTGFDDQGNALVNDPAAGADADVPRTYLRSELENVWLTNSGGVVYVIMPVDSPIMLVGF